jgi:hypothetical protein
MAQVNVVVPAKDADLVRRVGKGLREIEGFADALRRFIDGEASIGGAQRQTLAQQVAEAVVAAISPLLAGQAAAETTGADGSQRRKPRKQPVGQFDMDL